MNTSDQMRSMIEAWEGCRLTAYRDMVGVLTIGYGHTGDDVSEGQAITQERADQLLADDLHKFEVGVSGLVGLAATSQQQFDALVSFAYNLGEGALKTSTLLKCHKAGEYEAAAANFLEWDHAVGQVVEGLLKRRQSESAVYLRGEYT